MLLEVPFGMVILLHVYTYTESSHGGGSNKVSRKRRYGISGTGDPLLPCATRRTECNRLVRMREQTLGDDKRVRRRRG